MDKTNKTAKEPVARITGVALVLAIAIGIAGSVLTGSDININLTADAATTIEHMMDAGSRLYAKAYISVGIALLDILVAAGLFLLLFQHGRILALASFATAILGTIIVVSGALDVLNIANLLTSTRLAATSDTQHLHTLLVGHVVGDYTSFHLALVINSLAKAGYFWLFLRSRVVPTALAAFGLAATCFVAFAIVGREFLELLSHNAITIAFIVGNLAAHLALGLYLMVRGERLPVDR